MGCADFPVYSQPTLKDHPSTGSFRYEHDILVTGKTGLLNTYLSNGACAPAKFIIIITHKTSVAISWIIKKGAQVCKMLDSANKMSNLPILHVSQRTLPFRKVLIKEESAKASRALWPVSPSPR